MRVLLTTISEPSHLRTMVPLGWALLAAGHEIRVAVTPSLVSAVTTAGLPAVEVGVDSEIRKTFAGAAAQGDIENPLTDWTRPFADEQEWDELLLRYQVSTSTAFAGFNDGLVDGLVEFARGFRPDLVIWEPLTYAGPIAAAACGARQVRLSWMIDIYGAMREVFLELAAEEGEDEDPLADWMTDHLDRYGAEFDESLINGEFTIDMVPPSMQLTTGLDRVHMRAVPYQGAAVQPRWLDTPPGRPRVCITTGISWADALGMEPFDLPSALDALGELDIELVVAVPDSRVDSLTLPGNVVHAGYVPLQFLLPTCATVVHHSGYGTWANALMAGIPQHITTVVHADQSLRGDAVARAGSGIYLPSRDFTADRLTAEVGQLISDPGFRTAALAVAEEVRSMDPPARAVDILNERMDI